MSKVEKLEGIDLFEDAKRIMEEKHLEEGTDSKIIRSDYEIVVASLWNGLWGYIGSKAKKATKGKSVEINLAGWLVLGLENDEEMDESEDMNGNLIPYIMLGEKFTDEIGTEIGTTTKNSEKEYKKALDEAIILGGLERMSDEVRPRHETASIILECRLQAMAEFIRGEIDKREEGEELEVYVKEGEYFVIKAVVSDEEVVAPVVCGPLSKLAVKDNAKTE